MLCIPFHAGIQRCAVSVHGRKTISDYVISLQDVLEIQFSLYVKKELTLQIYTSQTLSSIAHYQVDYITDIC